MIQEEERNVHEKTRIMIEEEERKRGRRCLQYRDRLQRRKSENVQGSRGRRK